LADAQLCPDDDDYLDREQGIPHFKGIPCKINKLPTQPSTAESKNKNSTQEKQGTVLEKV